MEKLSSRTKWLVDGSRRNYYIYNETTNKWDLRNGNRWAYARFEFRTYDGNNVILYDPSQHEYVELSDEMVKIADSMYIEGLDTPNITMKGKWDTTSDRSQTCNSYFFNLN